MMHGHQNTKINFLICFGLEVFTLEVVPSILDTVSTVQQVTLQKAASTCRLKIRYYRPS
jgi:hypothetical protein